ncbi:MULTISPECIES: sensor histidine kinase [Flavobacteriaceae]|uniref:sensor histidine kinase n=1 Tax=Flavobacteriaceae TaxID=49546 RepID=UPI0014930C07|nr:MULTISPECIES: sensor histidine kinase [Allomuricauda]MDC6366947.1 histidine kinase [Muricauda sp. AC10]
MLKNKDFWINLLIGMGLLSVPILTSPDSGSFKEMWYITGFQRDFLGYSLLLLFFYLNYHWLVPKFYSEKKYLLYISILLVCLAIISFIPDLLVNQNYVDRTPMPPSMPGQGQMPPPGMPPRKPPLFNIFVFRDSFILQFIMVIILSFLLRLDNRLKEMQHEKLKAEVSYLKAQINPHFLFNTLNSIYALTLKKSDDAPRALLKLSEMMRYVVTESNVEAVPLQQEIQYISDYIELQKLRIGKGANFTYEVSGDPFGKKIAPIILVNYVENAFKYGVNPDKPSKISIFITVDVDGVELLVENSITVNRKNLPEHTEEGNRNTLKRLDYFYPGKYQLNVNHQKDYYIVKLYINLK